MRKGDINLICISACVVIILLHFPALLRGDLSNIRMLAVVFSLVGIVLHLPLYMDELKRR